MKTKKCLTYSVLANLPPTDKGTVELQTYAMEALEVKIQSVRNRASGHHTLEKFARVDVALKEDMRSFNVIGITGALAGMLWMQRWPETQWKCFTQRIKDIVYSELWIS
jgi:hypothetical protein